MHDQKFEKIFRPRPEDGLYGSNEPKKCEIRPVVSSIVHFKVFKSYFIYNSRLPCSKNMSWSATLSIGKSSTGISPTGGMATRNWNIIIRNNILFSLASFQCSPQNSDFPLWFVPLASISINHLLAKHPVLKESFIINSTKQKVHLIPCLSLFILKCAAVLRNLKKIFPSKFNIRSKRGQNPIF